MGEISGMTGFSRAEGAGHGLAWTIEARSVNGRGLELRFRGPPGREGLERPAREAAQARFQRGQISIALNVRRSTEASEVRINVAALESFAAASKTLVAQGGVNAPSADGLLALKGVIETADEEIGAEAAAAADKAISRDIEATIDRLRLARLEEGAALKPVIGGHIEQITGLVALAEHEAAAQTEAVRDRFTRRLAELGNDVLELHERILQEAAVLAAKADVREELDRLAAHLVSARELLQTGTNVGRRFDFLTQELMREVNTLCSKSATLALTRTGLDLKAVVEQLREQIQNVE